MKLEPTKAEQWVPRIRAKLGTAVEGIVQTGHEFIAAKKALADGEFGRLGGLLGLNRTTVFRFMAIAKNAALSDVARVQHLPPSWGTLYELSKLDAPRLQLALDRGEVSPTLERRQARKLVQSYAEIDVGDNDKSGHKVFGQGDTESGFNVQTNENIGWARWSWNPVTGCENKCPYCYARDIANRFFPQKFAPTFFPERLDAPANTKLPGDADPNDPSWHRVFTCSVADLFGNWVPQKWINPIFKQIEEHQEWEFLCLTKFPQRLAELDWPANVWAGTTVDQQHRVKNAERSFAKLKAGIKWLSCEPLLEPLKFTSLAMFDWVVIGASTGSTLVAPFAPPFEWVVDLYMQARASGCKVYLKHNLFGAADGRGPGMKPIHEWPR